MTRVTRVPSPGSPAGGSLPYFRCHRMRPPPPTHLPFLSLFLGCLHGQLYGVASWEQTQLTTVVGTVPSLAITNLVRFQLCERTNTTVYCTTSSHSAALLSFAPSLPSTVLSHRSRPHGHAAQHKWRKRLPSPSIVPHRLIHTGTGTLWRRGPCCARFLSES